MSVPRFDRTLTNGEVKAMIGPMCGLSLGDDFDVTIIVEGRHNGELHESIFSTTDDMGMVERASGVCADTDRD